MTAQYHLRSLAQDDLESIRLYTVEHWGVTQADSYLELLINLDTNMLESQQKHHE